MSESTFGDAVSALDAANSAGDSTPVATATPTETPSFSQSQQAPQTVTAPTTNAVPYADHLAKIPEGFRGVVEPIFKEWDQNVNQRFEQVHSRYEPYKFLTESNTSPDDIRQAMELQRLLVNDPQRVYDALAEHFGADQGQGQALDEPQEEFDLGEGDQQQYQNDPRIAQLEQQIKAQQEQQQALIAGMQQAQQSQQQAAAAAEGEQWLDSRVKAAEEFLTTKVGIKPTEHTWNYILSVASGLSEANPNKSSAANDEAFGKAVDSYVQQVQSMRAMPTANQSAPMVLPTGGGTPSNVVPTDMSDQDRRKLAVGMFSQALKDS